MLARPPCQTGTVLRPRERLQSARLYLVCGGVPDALLEAALRGGVDIVQLRIKEGDDHAVLAAGRRFARACAEHGALLILNDRPDLVPAAGADGVHIGQDDGPVALARALVGPQRLVGLSTHTAEQIEDANGADVDYIGVGPVHETPTKPGRPAVGLELVRYAAERARHPFFAIGGIEPSNVDAVVRAGARRIAAVRALTESADPERQAMRLRGALEAGREPVGSA
jgi:thiamine-phosphate pyrophosphorylase